ncbi:MAG: hypothetical protein EOO10_13735 [Chitinophagaceae bacterium]|nr:MAG: hypothetical protein EOO10_13735 [Chitinophagaceae bacterium]
MVKHFTFLLLLVLNVCCAFSQNLDSLLLIQRMADPQEKIYVHFDKNYYNPGETIWFKAYVFAGIDPSETSKNFYAELVDEQGNVFSQKTSPIAFSGASGSFDLDSSLNKRIVYFRGYTISMLNSDTSFLYTKAIRILTTKGPTTKTSAFAKIPAVKFLPEGGDWVLGLPSKIAFIATDQQELPVAISGSIIDNKGTKLTDFKTLHNGMGQFALIPEEGKTYSAVWKDATGKQYTTALPAAKTQGAILKITDESGNKRFSIYRSNEAPDELKQVHVVGHFNQQMAFRSNINLENRLTAAGIFPTGELPSGILQITLFDNNYKPIAERICFINNRNYELDGDAYFTQKNFAKRGLNQVEILLSDTVPANLSLSIVDADLNDANAMDDNIISRMLLTGDLRGKIVDPYYYFFSNADSAAIHLDMVMLTHGWRRYNWENVIAGRTPTPRWKESNYLSLNGKVAGLLPGSFSTDLQLVGILQTADSAKNFINLPVQRNGNISMDGLIFYDNAKLYFNFNKKSLTFDKSMLIVDNGLRKGFTKIVPDTAMKLGLPEISAAIAAINQKYNRMSLQASRLLAKSNVMANVTVSARAKTAKDKMEEKYVSGLFTGDARSFDLVNDPLASAYMDIFQYLQGKVAGLQISTGGGEPSLSWRGGSPVVYLNEMQADVSMLQSTPVSDIAYVKVFRPGESIVSGGGNGVIAIYTRKGGDAQPDQNARGLSYVQFMGYSPIKQFYSPDYATVSERHSYDDVRSTLYWEPNIFLDKGRRRLRVKFYNNDITKKFRLVMEGFNSYGRLIHVEKEISE